MESLQNTSVPSDQEPSMKHCKRGGWTTFSFIIGAVMGLTLAAGSWSSNLIVFLVNVMNIKSINATQINNIILGSYSLFPIAGAVIADSFFSSFHVVSVFASVSLLGMIILTLASTIPSLRPPTCVTGSLSCEAPSKIQYAALYSALALASFGLGGTRFTIATFGADQFAKPDDQGTFFSWYFITLYLASAISLTAIVYVQDNVSWGLGFGLGVAVNAIGLAVFLLGKRFYRHTKPKGSPFASIARVLAAAFRKRRKLESFQSQDYFHGDNTKATSGPTESFRFLNRAALRFEDDRKSDGSYASSWWLCTVEEVEDLKTLFKIMPLWSSSILLSTSIAMINSLTVLQALTMDRHLGPHFKIPAGSFLVFCILATALSIFIIDRFLLPLWKKLTRRSLKPLQQIGIGHVINMFAMVGSASVETRRLRVVRNLHLDGEPPGSVVPMSGLWLVVPMLILGVGESFHFPGQVALYYQEFPKSLRSTSTAMISLLIGIAYYLSTAITDLVRRSTGWLPNNINDGRLDYVFWLLTVIAFVNFGYFLLCATLFRYRNTDDNHENEASG
ncbi:protein NRT1/ PTR FAMILY [Salix suchowensis]|nr:protein NRT1/ PTR FAMILY [Salix suchowensis]